MPKGLFSREEWKILEEELENTGRRDEKRRGERFCVGSHGRKAAAKGFRHSHQ